MGLKCCFGYSVFGDKFDKTTTVLCGGGRMRAAVGDSSLVTIEGSSGAVTRRRFLALAGMGAAAGILVPGAVLGPAAAQSDGRRIAEDHLIHPRDVWGADLPPKGDMLVEAREDVRFLVVHHSASPNDYKPEESVRYLRSFYRYHTSPEKGWPDIAYNFLVDRYGQVFEGRQGSIDSPVRGDATGGSQGFALLTCFIGDHSEVAPSDEAQAAMVALLAWLGGAYQIDTNPGATVEFVSRGSDLHPEGKLVATPTITGHRTMSRTTCPGDRAFDLVQSAFPAQVTALLSGADPVPATTEAVPSSSVVPTVSITQVQSEPVSTTEAATEQGVVAETQTQGAVEISDGQLAASLATAPLASEVADPQRPTTTTTAPDGTAVSSSTARALADQGPEAVASRSNRILDIVGVAICTIGAGVEFWRRRRNAA